MSELEMSELEMSTRYNYNCNYYSYNHSRGEVEIVSREVATNTTYRVLISNWAEWAELEMRRIRNEPN